MALLRVNPTRMELKRLKGRLKIAVRGHKLLKDKTDEMIRKFLSLARETKVLRETCEAELLTALSAFMLARASDLPLVTLEAVFMPARRIELTCTSRKIMGVTVPQINVASEIADELYPYSFISVSSELDNSIAVLSELTIKLIKLAETEKACNMLADEIEKNKRRVNALENVLIPQLTDTAKFISMKLDENERGSLVRLMKVKSMIDEKK